MYKTLADIDPNEIVTKSYLREVLNTALEEQLQEFKRYTAILSEEFQSRIGSVTDLVIWNRDKILEHDAAIKELQKHHF